ncbi:hypothetical protein ACEPPN_019324 [Leptodophora sp. 'Broadleaf-Isolate-01']
MPAKRSSIFSNALRQLLCEDIVCEEIDDGKVEEEDDNEESKATSLLMSPETNETTSSPVEVQRHSRIDSLYLLTPLGISNAVSFTLGLITVIVKMPTTTWFLGTENFVH